MSETTLLPAAKRLVAACDKVGIDGDTLNDPYNEWCAALYELRRLVAIYEEYEKLP